MSAENSVKVSGTRALKLLSGSNEASKPQDIVGAAACIGMEANTASVTSLVKALSKKGEKLSSIDLKTISSIMESSWSTSSIEEGSLTEVFAALDPNNTGFVDTFKFLEDVCELSTFSGTIMTFMSQHLILASHQNHLTLHSLFQVLPSKTIIRFKTFAMNSIPKQLAKLPNLNFSKFSLLFSV